MRSLVLAVCAGGLSCSVATADQVMRRGGANVLEGNVTIVDDAGVTIRSDTGAEHFARWDTVRNVQMDQPDAALAKLLDRAEDLWRARSRLQRGDAYLAENLFREHFDPSTGATHETALVIAEGFLRCLARRGANSEAVIAAIEVIRLRRAGIRTNAFDTLEPIYDGSYSLVTVVPPVWIDGPELIVARRHLENYDTGDDRVLGLIVDFYLESINIALSEPTPVEYPREREPGLAMLVSIVQAYAEEPAARRWAIERLEAGAGQGPSWARAWHRCVLGSALIDAPNSERREEGMIHLVHIAATSGNDEPYLAGIALHRLAGSLTLIGDKDGAESMLDELAQLYPSHPVLHIAPSRPTTAKQRTSPETS